MKLKATVLLLGGTLLATSSASAGVVFSEDFEAGNLDQWFGKNESTYSAQIVDDPLNASGETNHAMNFAATTGAGDIFTSTFLFAAGDYVLTFDYYGDMLQYGTTSDPNYDTGGYIGYSAATPGDHTWLLGTGGLSEATVFANGVYNWNTYAVAFTSDTSFRLMLEDYSFSPGGAGDAYFDNIQLTSPTSPVPEPATMLLFGTGLIGLAGGCLRRKKK